MDRCGTALLLLLAGACSGGRGDDDRGDTDADAGTDADTDADTDAEACPASEPHDGTWEFALSATDTALFAEDPTPDSMMLVVRRENGYPHEADRQYGISIYDLFPLPPGRSLRRILYYGEAGTFAEDIGASDWGSECPCNQGELIGTVRSGWTGSISDCETVEVQYQMTLSLTWVGTCSEDEMAVCATTFLASYEEGMTSYDYSWMPAVAAASGTYAYAGTGTFVTEDTR
jgi:hypothetical protein